MKRRVSKAAVRKAFALALLCSALWLCLAASSRHGSASSVKLKILSNRAHSGSRLVERLAAVPATVPAAVPTPTQQFVITIISAHRPGNVSYLGNTLSSLYCALADRSTGSTGSAALMAGGPADPTAAAAAAAAAAPGTAEQVVISTPVLLINTEVPASRHTAAEVLRSSGVLLQYEQRGLRYMTMPGLHSELHAPEFVLDLSNRIARGQQATPSVANKTEDAASDPADRFLWRSKEVLDTSFALDAALTAFPTASYIIFLQDDIQVAPGMTRKLESFLSERAAAADPVDIVTLFTSGAIQKKPVRIPNPFLVHYGAVGLVMHAPFAREFVAYSRARFADAPIDWLLNQFINGTGKALWGFYPNLINHVGRSSSFAGKVQPIVSSSFRDKGCWVT